MKNPAIRPVADPVSLARRKSGAGVGAVPRHEFLFCTFTAHPSTDIPQPASQPAALPPPARRRISRLQVVDAQDGPEGEAFFRSGRPPFGPADGIITNDVSITASPRWQITARRTTIPCKDGSAPSPDSPGRAEIPGWGRFTPVSRSPSVADVVAVVRPTKTRAPANGAREPDLSSLFAAI